MEEMRIPKIFRKVMSDVASYKLGCQLGIEIPIELKQVDMSVFDSTSTLKVNAELTIRNEDIPKLLKQLGIM